MQFVEGQVIVATRGLEGYVTVVGAWLTKTNLLEFS